MSKKVFKNQGDPRDPNNVWAWKEKEEAQEFGLGDLWQICSMGTGAVSLLWKVRLKEKWPLWVAENMGSICAAESDDCLAGCHIHHSGIYNAKIHQTRPSDSNNVVCVSNY